MSESIARPLELEEGLARAGGDLEFYKELLELFLESAPAQIDEMRTFDADGDNAALTRVAHALKGAAANLSACEIGATAAAVESLARDGGSSRVTGLIEALEKQVAELAEYSATL